MENPKNVSNQQTILKLFKISNPLSVNGKSVYRQDYESLLDSNWLRTQAISSLITLIEKEFHLKVDTLLEEELKNQTLSEGLTLQTLSENLKSYVKFIDPFVVTMILSTQQDFILQTLEGLEIFCPKTKYILFPMNTDHGKGNHWFLNIFKNPRYHHQEPQILILNSIPSSKQDSSVYMTNELSHQILRLLSMFHPEFKTLTKFPAHRIEKITHQSNSFDCGIFTVAYLEKFLMEDIFEREIQHAVKLRLWEKQQVEEEKKDERSLNSKSEFLILKPSSLMRKIYRERLEVEIMVQNATLLG